MNDGTLDVLLHDGRRQRLANGIECLVSLLDWRQKVIRSDFTTTGAIRFSGLPVVNGPQDCYTVFASAKGHSDAGMSPVKVTASVPVSVGLMLLPRKPAPAFTPFRQIPTTTGLFTFLCAGIDAVRADVRHTSLAATAEGSRALACLLNLAEALEQIKLLRSGAANGLPSFDDPLSCVMAVEELAQDRIFAWVDARLPKQLQLTAERDDDTLTRFVPAPFKMHPGATGAYKQTDFGEGNVQFSYSETTKRTVGGVDCIKVDIDIDYFKDPGSHLLFEVFPNTLKQKFHGKDSSTSLTDPYKVYGLRWMAARLRSKRFEPAYTL